MLGNGLRSAYLAWGPHVAEAVSERLVDFLLATWDGLFIAIQAGDARSTTTLVDQLVDSVHRLAEQVREDFRHP